VKDGELISDDFRDKTEQTILNIKSILEQNNLSLKNVVDVTVFLADQKNYNAFNEEYIKFFSEPYPARTVVTVKSLPREAKVEIKVIAAK